MIVKKVQSFISVSQLIADYFVYNGKSDQLEGLICCKLTTIKRYINNHPALVLFEVSHCIKVMVFNTTLAIFQFYRGGQFGGGNQSSQRKQKTCRKSLTKFIT